MKSVFLDSGAWVAISSRRDQYHESAAGYLRQLVNEQRKLVTTNLVVAESYLLILRGGGNQAAVGFLDGLAASTRLDVVYSDAVAESTARQILRQYDDQDFSYTDAVSFAVMRARGIQEAFTFDNHFTIAGFDRQPQTLS